MRVLAIGSVYPPHLLGGYEVIWHGVTAALAAAGHGTRVLVSDHRDPAVTDGDDPDVLRELEWYWRDHRWRGLSFRARLALERANRATLERHLAEWRPDVVAFWPMGGMSLSLITQVAEAGLPAIFFVLDPWTVYGPQRDGWLAGFRGPLGRAIAPLVRASTGLPTRVSLGHGRWVFCSEWMRTAAALGPLPSDADRQTVLTPGVEPRFLARPVAPAEVARRWEWRLLYLGRVVEQKGVLTAIDALARLPEAARLTIVGTGDADYRALCETRAAQLGVAERIVWREAVDRAGTVAAYAACDVALHPVLWGEPWGLVPLEAMGVGRPVVATGRGGSGDFLVDGENALLFDGGDADALARAILRLADDEVLRARLVAAGRRTAEAHTAAAFEAAAVREIERTAGDRPADRTGSINARRAPGSGRR